MASTARIDELKKKFDENPRRYFAPLANEFRKAGDIDQAIMICEEFLPQQPGHMSGHIVYGQALYEAGKMPESRAVFETALGLDPENLIALRHLGDIARNQSDHPAARSWYVRVLDADPRNEEIQALIATVDSERASAEPGATVEEPASIEAPAFEIGLDFEKELAPFESETVSVVEEVVLVEEDFVPADPSLADTSPLGMPVIPSSLHATSPSAGADLLDGFSTHGFDTPADSASESRGYLTPAEGLESTAFVPPEEHIPETAELDASLESGVPSFLAPAELIESLPGLQGSGDIPGAELDDSDQRSEQHGFASVSLDEGLVLPPQGDPLYEPAVNEAVPVELPPEVIAAEAELIEAGETPAPEAAAALGTTLEEEQAGRPPFVTETMAELYLAQGFPTEALSVYSQLLAADPDDARLSGLVASLTHSAPVEDTGPTVRNFFARLAARRPGTRSAAAVPPSDADFVSPVAAVAEDPPEEAPYDDVEVEAVEEVEVEAELEVEVDVKAEAEAEVQSDDAVELIEEPPPEAVAPAIDRAAAMRTPGGSIDALFSNRAPGTSEDSAASALAQAFGGAAVVQAPIVGRPARAASGELSLDSVFRDGPARPPRTSQSFSFDQFFTGTDERNSGPTPARTSSELAAPGEAPAERSADDIEQFNSWLQGLKQR